MKLWNNKGVVRGMGNMQLPDKNNYIIPVQLKSVIKRLQSLQDSEGVTDIFRAAASEIKDFRALNDLVYYYKNFIFCKMLRNQTDVVAKKLEFANSLDLTSAPVLIDHIKVDNVAGVIIVSFQNCKEKLPIPYHDYEATIGPVNNNAKEQFLDDVKMLLDNNKNHPFVSEGPSYWLVSPESGQIILESWSLLSDIKESEKEDILLNLTENLFSH